MSRAAFSVTAFGIYLIGEGALLIALPNLLLSLFGMPAALDVWIRVTGLAVVILGYFYTRCGLANMRQFFELSLHTRSFQFAFFIVLVALQFISPMILLVSGVELASAVWTLLALRADKNRESE
jgi:hypothetical protein